MDIRSEKLGEFYMVSFPLSSSFSAKIENRMEEIQTDKEILWQPSTTLLPRSARRKLTRGVVLIIAFLALAYFFKESGFGKPTFQYNYVPIPLRPERYPVEKIIRLPTKSARKIPKIQHAVVAETVVDGKVREARLAEVKNEFVHAWKGYKKEAWMHDELRPIQGGFKEPFCGWAATMVDALDTLCIMGLKEEWGIALAELRSIDFTNTQGCQVNLFETTIRHLGGLLSAFDISGGKDAILVQKAVELAEILYTAFDTPNRMPSPHYLWSA